MATVNVSTWAELTAAITGATENTDINLTSDIDLNVEIEDTHEITTTTKGTNYNITIYGNNHKISNIYSKSAISAVFQGYSTSKKLRFEDTTFENVYLSYTTSTSTAPTLAKNTDLYRCQFSAEIAMSARLFGSDVYLSQCGGTATGSGEGNAYVNSSQNTFEFSNIELYGKWRYVSIALKNSYLGGDFEQIGTGTNTGLIFGSSYLATINATIVSDKNPQADNAKLLLANSETWSKSDSSTVTFPSTMIPLTTTQLQSRTELRNIGYPVL